MERTAHSLFYVLGSETFLDGSNLNGDDSAKQKPQRSNDVSETTATDTTEKKKDSLDKSSHRKKKKNEKKKKKKPTTA